MQPLSEEWFRRAGTAVAALDVPADLHVAVGQVVLGAPGGDLAYQVVCTDGRCELRRSVDDAAVVLTESYATACDIALGRRSAGHALLDGDIAIEGDATHLIAATPILGQLTAAMAGPVDDPGPG